MTIYPAIDLFGGKAVRLVRGDYEQMTVYSDDPCAVARDFRACGASCIHLVDLEGARSGRPENLETIRRILAESGLFAEVGGGIRTMETAEQYLEAGVGRIILGTAAVTDEAFLRTALARFGERIAVGVDLRDGYVAVRGWTERSDRTAEDFFERLEALGVSVVVCTDISRDGAMGGANGALYRALGERFRVKLIASGGVSSLEEIRRLRELGLYGAIVGKAYYVGAVDLKEAIEVAE